MQLELLQRATWPDDPDLDDFLIVCREPDGNPAREVRVGRIFRAGAAPKERPWFWTLSFHQRTGRTEPYQGYAKSFEQAKDAWKHCWESGSPPINWPPSLRG